MRMYSRNVRLTIACFLLVLMIAGNIFVTFHSHHELEWNDPHSSEFANTQHSLSADTYDCSVCLFFQKTDGVAETYDGVVFHSSKGVFLTNEIAPSYKPKIVVKGRSPPTIF